jgi:MFS family permease
MAARPSYRSALSNRDFRLIAGALTESAMGDWAYGVAFVVYVYSQTHSAGWVSASMLVRVLPRFAMAPYAGVLAEKFERIRVLVTADLIRCVQLALLAVTMAVHAPIVLILAIAFTVQCVSTVYEPATMAMLPQLLGEDDLAAGNAMTETINNVAIIVGPAIGAVVLAVGNASIVMAIDSLTFLTSAWLVSRVKARSTPSDVSGDGGVFKQMTVGIKSLFGSSTALVLTAFPFATTMLYGIDTVLFVFISKDKLGTGARGYGYLLIALGVGGVIAAAIVNRLAALPRLSAVLALGMGLYTLPTALLLVSHRPAVAYGVEILRGIGTLVVDVLAMTALQRSLPPALISRVFSAFLAVIFGGLALGAFITPFLLHAFGLDATIALDAFVVPAVVVVAYPKLASLDRAAAASTAALAPRVSVLAQLDIFAAAARPSLERLAQTADELVLEPGTRLITEGETADALYVLLEGELAVSARGEGRARRRIRTMHAPAYVGEIGVLEHVARTATVTAETPARLLRIGADNFYESLTGTSFTGAFIASMSSRLAKTHPSQTITIPQQREDDEIHVAEPQDVRP